jgi:diguanylate cyclase (GGDEF)-like protein
MRMKARYTPLRVRFLIFGALAFTALSFATLAFQMATVRQSAEANRQSQIIGEAQLVKLYLETSMPGDWREEAGYLYRGEARVAYGPETRQALSPYLSPGTELLFLLGLPDKEAFVRDGKGDIVREIIETAEGDRASQSSQARERFRADRPFATDLGAGVVVRDSGNAIVGWILVAEDSQRDSKRAQTYILWTFIVLDSVIFLFVAGFSVILLRLTKPIDRMAEEREAARARNIELAKLSETDPLTGLRNRRGMEAALEAMDREGKGPSHVAILDVDHFKLVNDSRGHDEGDRVLRGIACLLASSVRNVDLCGRWGGEEFIVAFSDLGDDHAAASAERIRAAVAAHSFGSENSPLGVTVTLGIAAVGEAGFEEALGRADRAMYRGKHEGRNRVVVG